MYVDGRVAGRAGRTTHRDAKPPVHGGHAWMYERMDGVCGWATHVFYSCGNLLDGRPRKFPFSDATRHRPESLDVIFILRRVVFYSASWVVLYSGPSIRAPSTSSSRGSINSRTDVVACAANSLEGHLYTTYTCIGWRTGGDLLILATQDDHPGRRLPHVCTVTERPSPAAVRA